MFVQHFQRDNFQQLNAFKVWENILKWIIAQFPNLPSNPSLYFKDDVNILSKDLRESLVNHFIKNPKPKITKEIRSESIDSNIITIQHVELISRWIDKLRVTDKTKNVVNMGPSFVVVILICMETIVIVRVIAINLIMKNQLEIPKISFL
ncbi:carbohydrate-binding module family 13 protein [Rhizophagus irregularis DAOM 181602=DAOM 197198]|nr:carbohydrate-binding module family 13 protein [Rhizophagus irregularis DAOM 181602=DAOM 197198]